MMRKEVQKKKVKGFAIDTFVQKGVCWSLAVFCGSVLVLGLLLRIIDALLFTQEEPSTCLWEVLFCGLATGALLLSTGPKIVKKSSKATPSKAAPLGSSRCLPDEEAQVARVVRQLREAEFHCAEKEFLRLARHELSTPSTQSLIAACADVDVTRASGWLQVLRKNGRQISPKSFQLVVDALIKEVRMVEAEELVLKMLECPISVISGGLVALFRQLELERIEELLLKLRQVGSRHWIFGLSVLLRSERHISCIEDVEVWMQRAIDAKVPLEGNLFNSCITALARLGHPVLAEKWLKRMVCHAAPDPNSIATVISAYKTAKKRPVDDYLQRIKAKELHLDVSAFNQIIKSCVHLEDVDDAHRWLHLATDICDGPSLDSLWYSTVIGLSLRVGKAEIAERWITFQVERGFTKDPSSFNAVITCHARQGTFQAAERLVRFMCEQGVEPDLVTLGAAVHSCARGNRPRKAEEMFQMIVQRGHTRPDVVAFNALIDAWVRAEDVQRAEEWLRQMLEAQVEPSVVSYSSILHAYAKQGNIEAAEKVMQQMKEKKLEANVVTYTTLINACVKAGDIPRAEKFFELMQNAGIEANAMTYSSLLNVCAKAGDYQRAEVWLEKMCGSVVPTEVCFNNVIDACAKAGQAKRAEEWLWRLQGDVTHGLSATRQSFTAAAQAYAKTGAFSDVERLFRAMEAQGISMDAFCLTVQLSSYARARPRQRERMEEALRKYQAQGLRITPPPLRVAKSVLGNSRLQQLMLELGMQAPRDASESQWP